MSGDARVVASAPDGPVAVPAALVGLADGESAEAVWVNELGGVTFALPRSRRYVKWQPAGTALDLAAEAARLAWAGRFTPVPLVLETGADDDNMETVEHGDDVLGDRVDGFVFAHVFLLAHVGVYHEVGRVGLNDCRSGGLADNVGLSRKSASVCSKLFGKFSKLL